MSCLGLRVPDICNSAGGQRMWDVLEQIQQIYSTGKSLRFIRNTVKPLAKKYFCFRKCKSGYINSHPVPPRGALRNVPARGEDAVDVDGAPDEGA